MTNGSMNSHYGKRRLELHNLYYLWANYSLKIEKCPKSGSILLELYGLCGVNSKSERTFMGSFECSWNDQITTLLQLAAVTDL